MPEQPVIFLYRSQSKESRWSGWSEELPQGGTDLPILSPKGTYFLVEGANLFALRVLIAHSSCFRIGDGSLN